MSHPHTLILLRHGQSTWNAQNLFTGWIDVPLAQPAGTSEATRAGHSLLSSHHLPDIVHTSLLRRAIVTADLALDAADRLWIPVKRAWELNERHYGGLQGKDKAAAAATFGEAQVKLWRRSFDTRPPEADEAGEGEGEEGEVKEGAGGGGGGGEDADGRYARMGVRVPRTECLKDVLARVLPYWEREIVPDLKAGKTVLVAAHGNSLRALVKELEGISDDEIPGLEIPTGVPILYELDENMKPKGGKGRQLG